MPLWSLTQERVEKLRRQIGDIEMEVDTLIKITKEALWKTDLDLFIEEWRAQLDEEHKRKRRINNMGRRTSTKVKVAASGPTIKARKGLGDYDDDDFDDRPKSKKPAPAKVKRKEIYVEKKQPLIPSMFDTGQGTQGKNPSKFHDGNSSEPEPEESTADTTKQGKKVKPAAKQKTVPIFPDSDGKDNMAKPVARKARAAASKPIQYGGGSDSDDSNGDDLLGDITNMVKGLPGGETKSSADAKSLFSTSRAIPSGSVGLKPVPSAATKNYAEVSDDDDTNFVGLVPQQSPRRSINVVQNALLTDDEDEEEADIRPLTTNKSRSRNIKSSKLPPSQKKNPVVKSDAEAEDDDGGDAILPKTKTKSRPVPSSQAPQAPKVAPKKPAPVKKDPAPKKTKTAPAAAKKTPLSPAAKAYAAKQAKAAGRISYDPGSSEDENNIGPDGKLIKADKLYPINPIPLSSEDEALDAMADDLLDSPIDTATRTRVAENSAPAVVKKKAAPTAAAAAGTGRPARRAAIQKKKPIYVVSDEDDEDSEDGGFGAKGDQDEESEDDFEESE
jgi:DNA topoisomerase II